MADQQKFQHYANFSIDDFRRLKLDALKQILRDFGLRVTGNKPEVIQRLYHFFHSPQQQQQQRQRQRQQQRKPQPAAHETAPQPAAAAIPQQFGLQQPITQMQQQQQPYMDQYAQFPLPTGGAVAAASEVLGPGTAFFPSDQLFPDTTTAPQLEIPMPTSLATQVTTSEMAPTTGALNQVQPQHVLAAEDQQQQQQQQQQLRPETVEQRGKEQHEHHKRPATEIDDAEIYLLEPDVKRTRLLAEEIETREKAAAEKEAQPPQEQQQPVDLNQQAENMLAQPAASPTELLSGGDNNHDQVQDQQQQQQQPQSAEEDFRQKCIDKWSLLLLLPPSSSEQQQQQQQKLFSAEEWKKYFDERSKFEQEPRDDVMPEDFKKAYSKSLLDFIDSIRADSEAKEGANRIAAAGSAYLTKADLKTSNGDKDKFVAAHLTARLYSPYAVIGWVDLNVSYSQGRGGERKKDQAPAAEAPPAGESGGGSEGSRECCSAELVAKFGYVTLSIFKANNNNNNKEQHTLVGKDDLHKLRDHMGMAKFNDEELMSMLMTVSGVDALRSRYPDSTKMCLEWLRGAENGIKSFRHGW